MKFDAMNGYPYTAEIWKIAAVDPNTGEYFYAYDRTINIQFTTWVQQNTISTEEPLEVWESVRNIRDINGADIVNGQKYQVKAIQPIVNPYGYAEGYSYLLGVYRGE